MEMADERPDTGGTACESRVLDAAFGAFYAAMPAAAGAAAYAFFWNGSWLPFWVAAGVVIGVQLGLRVHIWTLRIAGWRIRRSVEQREAEIRVLQQEIALTEAKTHRVRLERLQLEALNSQMQVEISQMQTEIAQKDAYRSALRAEVMELERLMLQRKIDQEAREARQRLEIACTAIEADRLEVAAWRMEITAKQLDLKLNQADLFESLSAIEDNAQDRILAAYEQGVDHGKRGIVIPHKYLRHLRVVEESA